MKALLALLAAFVAGLALSGALADRRDGAALDAHAACLDTIAEQLAVAQGEIVRLSDEQTASRGVLVTLWTDLGQMRLRLDQHHQAERARYDVLTAAVAGR